MAARGFDRNFAVMTAATFGFWFAVTIHVPVMPMYLSTFDLTTGQVGGIYGSAALFAIVGRLIAVAQVDTTGQRGLLAVGATLWLTTALIPSLTSHLGLVILSWLVKGLGLGLFTTAGSAWVARYMPDETRGRGLSWWSAANPAATALAPPTAVWAITTHGYTTAFALSTVAAAVAMFAVLVPSSPGSNHDNPARPRVLRAALAPGIVGLLLAVTATGFMVFVPLQLSQSAQQSMTGWPLTLFAVGGLLVRFVSGPAIDRIGAVQTVRVGALVTAAGIIGIGLQAGSAVLVAASLLVGAGVGALSPALAAWTAQRAPASKRGAATGTYFLFYELGLFAGGFAFGSAIDVLGDAAYLVCGVFLLVAACVTARRGRATETSQTMKVAGVPAPGSKEEQEDSR